MSNYEKTPKGKFVRQRSNAKQRGIDWQLTFEEWMDIWNSSGKWGERGNKGYVMARNFDTGPYAVDNVKIVKTEINSGDSYEGSLYFYTNKYKKVTDEKLRQNREIKEEINIWPLNWATEEAIENNPFLAGLPYIPN